MKNAAKFSVVLVTAPDVKTARALSKGALRARLAACANLVPRIESHYWWRNKMESSPEILILFKTQKSKLASLERYILTKHPYETPEFLALPLTAGSQKYLGWLAANCR